MRPFPPKYSVPARPAAPPAATMEPATGPPRAREADPALVAERDRLTERFTIMQSEIGGLFYEMAIRDHIRLEILIERAAALQRVDTELSHVEHLLAGGDAAIGGQCPACGAAHARGAAFCSQCAQPLAP